MVCPPNGVVLDPAADTEKETVKNLSTTIGNKFIERYQAALEARLKVMRRSKNLWKVRTIAKRWSVHYNYYRPHELVNNDLSDELRKKFIFYWKMKYGYRFYEEIFATNKYGANVAQTQRTTDYYQADEQWWQIAKKEGFYVGPVEFDESVGSFTITIAIGVYDDRKDFIGAIKSETALTDSTVP